MTTTNPALWVENDVAVMGAGQAPAPEVIPAQEATPEKIQTPQEPQQPAQTAQAQAPEAKPAPAEPAPVPAFKPEEIFGQEFGEIGKVKSEWERLKSLEQEHSKIKAEYEKSKVEDPYLQSLISWTKEGKDRQKHDLVYFSDPTKMSPQEKVALKLQIDKGLSAEKALRFVEHQYKLGEEFDAEDVDVEMARTMLEMDAVDAHKYIEQFRAKESAVAPAFDYAAQVQSWKPQIESTLGTLKEIPLLDDIKFPVSQDTIKGATAHIEAVLGTEGVEMDAKSPEQQQAVAKMVKDYIIANEMDNILKYYRTEWEKKAIAKESNIPQQNGQTPVKTASAFDKYKHLPSNID